MADASEKNELLPFTDYPLNLPDDVALGVDRVRYQERLCKHIRSISAKRTVKFQLFESEADGQLPSQHTIEDQQSARQAIFEPRSEGFDCRIFSFIQKDSLRPFLITAPLLWELLDSNKTPLAFLDVLFAVHTETCISEESYGNVFLQTSTQPSPCYELSYQFKYAEANNRSRAFPWSIRRTEIFNRIETSGETIKSTWLIFNPKEDSELSKRLADKAQDPGKWAALKANPLRLHIAILSTYIDNWRDFLEDIGKQYSELKKPVWTADVEYEVELAEALSFKAMRSLRGLEERVQTVQVSLRQTERLVQAMRDLNGNMSLLPSHMYGQAEFRIISNALENITVRLEGYQTSAEALERRVQGILRLVTDALNVKNQNAAAKVQKFAADNQAVNTEISKGVYALAMDSVDDSTIARIVTLATLIYLPASFVATLFGMNFFDFDERSKRMKNETGIEKTNSGCLTGLATIRFLHSAFF
ncbi:hypothetical protein DBV05_g7677 [Lasiodiplodia theobromae]|uniref:CorA-like transporter domain-containing protein n=1 Tax=Lasiodiplodia theobromae TaxID=45133 RepID=A0A5N5D7T3_9PEZI|nr:hypothetical protein DBV05_g7677 [Lasiodiplodia theobromae]